MELFIISTIFLILNMIVLRKFAKREMFEGYGMLLAFIVVSFIPVINMLSLVVYIIILIANKYDNIDDFARAVFLIKKKNNDADNFKGKGYR